ncbi:SocA family protein [bacterium]|nr:SocA family protein [bacterium]
MPNQDKMRELILYISLLSESDEKFGVTKLNKLLFFIDFSAFKVLGNSVTGEEYQKLPQGPAPRYFLPLRNKMEQAKEILVRKEIFGNFSQDKIFALREPNLSVFTPNEIDLIHRVVDENKGKNATQISEESHNFIGWKLANDKETIPYETVLADFDYEPTAEDFELADSLETLAQKYVS